MSKTAKTRVAKVRRARKLSPEAMSARAQSAFRVSTSIALLVFVSILGLNIGLANGGHQHLPGVSAASSKTAASTTGSACDPGSSLSKLSVSFTKSGIFFYRDSPEFSVLGTNSCNTALNVRMVATSKPYNLDCTTNAPACSFVAVNLPNYPKVEILKAQPLGSGNFSAGVKLSPHNVTKMTFFTTQYDMYTVESFDANGVLVPGATPFNSVVSPYWQQRNDDRHGVVFVQ